MEKNQKIQQLLERGLYHYGLGETQTAIELWKEVLQLEPENEVAREYLSIELGEDFDKEKKEPEKKEEGAERVKEEEFPQEFWKAIQSLRLKEFCDAFLQFKRLVDENPGAVIFTPYLEIAKASLLKQFLKEVRSVDSVPELATGLDELSGKKFSQEQGFILSLINGEMSFEDILAISPLPRFINYYILHNFLRDGVVCLKTKGKAKK